MQKLEVGINYIRIDPDKRRKIIAELRGKAAELFEEVDRERREAERNLRIYRHRTGSAYLSNAYQPN